MCVLVMLEDHEWKQKKKPFPKGTSWKRGAILYSGQYGNILESVIPRWSIKTKCNSLKLSVSSPTHKQAAFITVTPFEVPFEMNMKH